jgi:hypothetical protein
MKTLTIEDAQFAALTTPVTAGPTSSRRTWTGRVLAGLPLVFMTWDASVKLLAIPQVIEGSARLGFERANLLPIGLIELAAVLLVLFPRTRIFGAVLLTAYLGGAVAVHVQHSDPTFSHTLFPIYFASMIWGGLSLLDRRVRAISPFTRSAGV